MMDAEEITRLADEIRARIRRECPGYLGLAVVELVATGVLAETRTPGTEREDAERLAGSVLRRLRQVRARNVGLGFQ